MQTSCRIAFLVCLIMVNISNLMALDSDNDGLSDSEEIRSIGSYILCSGATGDYVQQYHAACGNGTDYLITWDEYGYEADDAEIGGIIIGADGSVKVEQFQVNTSTARKQEDSAVCSINGNYLVVWHSREPDNEASDLFAQLLDSSGNKIGTEFQVNTYTTGRQYGPTISTIGNNYMVVWVSEGHYIKAQLLHGDGTKIGSEIQVNTYTSGPKDHPFIAASNSKYLVTWSCYIAETEEYDVHARFIDNDGNRIGPEFRVNDYTTDFQLNPSVASDGTNFMITWMSRPQDGDKYGIYAKQIDPSGNTIKPEFRINEKTFDAQMYPYICFNGTYYFVAWMDGEWVEEYGYTVVNEVHALSFDNEGRTMLPTFNFRIFSDTEILMSQELYPTIASNGSDFFLAWNNLESTWSDIEYSYSHKSFIGGSIVNPGYGTDPNNPDSDEDGLTDTSELKIFNTDPLSPDSDGDELSDGFEIYRYETDPNNPDSDADYINDNLEVNTYQTDPNDLDSDNDGIFDCEEDITITLSEGFEINSSNVLSWSCAGDECWMIYENDNPYSGDYCASSFAGLLDNESSTLILTLNLPFKSRISFKYRVSSEAFYDELKLVVNSVQTEQWSGNIPWSTYVLDLPAGHNTIEFAYEKDKEFSEGDDRACIDDVIIENSTYGTNPNDDDSDDDGCIDGDEIYAGTDPLDSASNYSIKRCELYINKGDIEGLILIWNASPLPECSYTIMCKKSPNSEGETVDLFSAPWFVCEDNIPNTSNSTSSWTDTDQDIHDIHVPCRKLYKIRINKQ